MRSPSAFGWLPSEWLRALGLTYMRSQNARDARHHHGPLHPSSAVVRIADACSAKSPASSCSGLPKACTAVVIVLMGAGVVSNEISEQRTRAPVVLAALDTRATTNDIVVYCPDQLSPALDRLIARSPLSTIRQRVYPNGTPERVDWVDYATRYADADPVSFTDTLLAEAGDRTIWLVWSVTNPPTQPACENLRSALSSRRAPVEILPDVISNTDHEGLWEYAAR